MWSLWLGSPQSMHSALGPKKGSQGGQRSPFLALKGWGAGEQGGDSPGTRGRLQSWGGGRSACFSNPAEQGRDQGPLCGRDLGLAGSQGCVRTQGPGPSRQQCGFRECRERALVQEHPGEGPSAMTASLRPGMLGIQGLPLPQGSAGQPAVRGHS